MPYADEKALTLPVDVHYGDFSSYSLVLCYSLSTREMKRSFEGVRRVIDMSAAKLTYLANNPAEGFASFSLVADRRRRIIRLRRRA